MNMKKVLALTLSVTMALSVTGCTSAENSSSTESKTACAVRGVVIVAVDLDMI